MIIIIIIIIIKLCYHALHLTQILSIILKLLLVCIMGFQTRKFPQLGGRLRAPSPASPDSPPHTHNKAIYNFYEMSFLIRKQ